MWAVAKKADALLNCIEAPGPEGAYTAVPRMRPHQPRVKQYTVHHRALGAAAMKGSLSTTMHSGQGLGKRTKTAQK